LIRAARLALLGACAIALAVPAGALAHGDPSSHYLEVDQLYPGFANRPSPPVELELMGLLEAAKQSGYPIKVSIVGSRDDLTEDTGMYETPQRYAEHVVSLLGRRNVEAPVLVVTPNGLGLAGAQEREGRQLPITRADAATLVRGVAVSRTATGDGLAHAAMRAVRRLARAGGHPLPAFVPPAKAIAAGPARGGGGIGWLPFVLFAGVFLSAWAWFEIRTRSGGGRTRPSLNDT
jgi:hypothetical protein